MSNNFEINKCYFGDAMSLVETLPDNFVDLVITSPPYANLKSYGDNVNILHPDKYVDWILPLFIESTRFLKPTGSFILNINDSIINGYRHPFVYELIYRITKETDLKFFDRYIWYKKTTLPISGNRRLNDLTEYIFHFVRDKKFKCNIDNIREPYAESSLKRYDSTVTYNAEIDGDGLVSYNKHKKVVPNPKGKKPGNVMRFNTASVLRKEEKHPAPFHPELPFYFIKYLTEEGDIVLDPFMGGGTTAEAAKKSYRNWVGFEINQEYEKLIKEKVNLLI